MKILVDKNETWVMGFRKHSQENRKEIVGQIPISDLFKIWLLNFPEHHTETKLRNKSCRNWVACVLK